VLPHSGDRLQPVSSVADDACADAYVRLRERLHGPERCIADELGISGYLAVATVATRARPAGRLAVSPDQAPQFLEAAAELGLYCLAELAWSAFPMPYPKRDTPRFL